MTAIRGKPLPRWNEHWHHSDVSCRLDPQNGEVWVLRAVCSAAVVLAGSAGLLLGVTKPAPRIGVVAIQDHEGRSLGFQALNNRLLLLLKNAGYRPVALEFQPSADVEHAARQ